MKHRKSARLHASRSSSSQARTVRRHLEPAANDEKKKGDRGQRAADLGARLAGLAAAKPDRPVFVRADGEVPYREVASLLGIAKQAGMPKVGLVFEPGVAAPAKAPAKGK